MKEVESPIIIQKSKDNKIVNSNSKSSNKKSKDVECDINHFNE